MSEDHWDVLWGWNSDPEVLYYSEGDDVAACTPEEVRRIYRGVSKSAFCFIIEVEGQAVGECSLQKMNLDRILRKYPGLDCRRIDLMIGEKEYWGQGIGTEVIRLLTEFGFCQEQADMLFGCDIADYNPRSLRVFQKVGYEIVSTMRETSGRKASLTHDVALSKERFAEIRDRGDN